MWGLLSLKTKIIAIVLIIVIAGLVFTALKHSYIEQGKAIAQAKCIADQAAHVEKVNKVFKKVKHEVPPDDDAYGTADWLLRHVRQ